MMPWTPFHNGQSIGTPGPENGRISRDDEHVLGARITLQQSEPNVFARTAPCALTCGIYGWMFHTRFFGNAAAATRDSDQMKNALDAILRIIPTKDEATPEKTSAVCTAVEEFVKRFP